MNEWFLFLVVLIPFIGGGAVPLIPWKKRRHMLLFLEGVVSLNSVLVWMLLLHRPAGAFTLVNFTGNLAIMFQLDGLGSVFAGLVSFLWPLATLYAFEYMTHEGKEDKFFAFFIMTFGVVLGIAFSGNFLTMYLFYEFLTLATLPLVMHAMDNKARHAGKTYILYMMFGASLAFIGFVFIYCYGNTTDFVTGGVLNPALVAGHEELLRMVFVMAFFGFGVKAAVFPFYRWLPKASVAPTPVTALLHAVAVVKSGIFAIIRLTYYSFGTSFLIGTWAQNVMLIIAAITIVFGSTVALRTPHIKRRFAYSTVSNLSYIIFGVAIMTPAGLAAGLLHMVCHAVIKITLFFTAGAILYKTHREYLYEVEGFAKYMPITFATMAITGVGLVGIPPFAGFNSKWALATAAVESGNAMAYFGIAALIISALLTALYIFYIIVRAYFPRKREYPAGYYDHVSDPNGYMTIPLVLLAVVSVVIALFPDTLLHIMQNAVLGIL